MPQFHVVTLELDLVNGQTSAVEVTMPYIDWDLPLNAPEEIDYFEIALAQRAYGAWLASIIDFPMEEFITEYRLLDYHISIKGEVS